MFITLFWVKYTLNVSNQPASSSAIFDSNWCTCLLLRHSLAAVPIIQCVAAKLEKNYFKIVHHYRSLKDVSSAFSVKHVKGIWTYSFLFKTLYKWLLYLFLIMTMTSEFYFCIPTLGFEKIQECPFNLTSVSQLQGCELKPDSQYMVCHLEQVTLPPHAHSWWLGGHIKME